MTIMATLADSFGGSSVDGSLWGTHTTSGTGTVTEGSGSVSLTCAATVDYTSLYALAGYDLTGSYFYFELVSAGAQNGNNVFYAWLSAAGQNVDNTCIYFAVADGTIFADLRDPSFNSPGSPLWTTTYSAIAHRYLRVRESAGAVYIDYSPDGVTWTNAWSGATSYVNTYVGAITALYPSFWLGDGAGGSVTTAHLANLNTAVALPTNSKGYVAVGSVSVAGSVAYVAATVVILAPDGSIVAYSGAGLPAVSQAVLNYGATEHDIQDALAAAVQTDAGDSTLDIEFV